MTTLPWSLIQITGPHAARFLQGQLTLNVHKNTVSLGAHCDPKGRVFATFYLISRQDDASFWMCLPTPQQTPLLKRLQSYARFSKVTLTPLSDPLYGFMNPSLPPPFHFENTAQAVFFTVPSVTTPRALFIQTPPPGPCLSPNQWALEDIHAGLPWILPPTQGAFTPHDINYPALGGVHFDKGCYVGQEIISRMHYRNQSKYTLAALTSPVPVPPAPGTPLAENTVGTVVNAAYDPQQPCTHLLAVVPKKPANASQDAYAETKSHPE